MANVSQRRIAGNLAYCAKNNPKILYDAFGPDVVKFYDDFTRGDLLSADTLVGWTKTLVEGGAGESTLTFPQASGGALLITTDAAENDGVNLTADGESFSMTASQKALYFGARLQISNATESDLFVGLSITATDILGGVTDSVGFRKVDGTTSLLSLTEKDSSETTSTALTVVAATNYDLEFYWDGTSVEFFVNQASIGKHTATIPNDELLTPSIHFLTGSANIRTCQVDWVRCIQIGRS